MKINILCSVFITITILSLCTGCSSFDKSTIKKGQRFYAYKGSGARIILCAYESSQSVKVSLKESGDALFFQADPIVPGSGTNTITELAPVVFPESVKDQYEISELRASAIVPAFYFSATEGAYPHENNKVLKYSQWRPYLQGMAVGLKFRNAIKTLPSQVEAGPSLALAPGIKHSWIRYKGTKNSLGYTSTAISVSGGFLAGLGTTAINAKTTFNKVTDADGTTNAILPLGIHAVAGLNNINIGFAVGLDMITGPNRKEWAYKNKMWTGIIIGFDIVK